MALTAGELRDELRPSVEGEKTLLIEISPGKRPEVTFTGAWSGKYIKAAMDSVAKAYRITRRRVMTPTHKEEITQTQPLAEGGK